MPLAAAEISSGNLAGVLRILLLSRDLLLQYLQVTKKTKQRTLKIHSMDLQEKDKTG
jgi:hypothetical protein